MSGRLLALALLAAMSLAACGGADEPRPRADTAADPPAATGEGTPIQIHFGSTTLSGRLHDNATARDLAAQLPVTATAADHNDAEKTGALPRELSTRGAPEGHDPAAGEIGYFAPGGDLVFYYDDAAPYFSGIVRIGQVRRQDGNLRVTVERAG